jgi:hypothetical protein
MLNVVFSMQKLDRLAGQLVDEAARQADGDAEPSLDTLATDVYVPGRVLFPRCVSEYPVQFFDPSLWIIGSEPPFLRGREKEEVGRCNFNFTSNILSID